VIVVVGTLDIRRDWPHMDWWPAYFRRVFLSGKRFQTIGASGNVAATSGSLPLRYWTLGYGKTATSRYEHIVA